MTIREEFAEYFASLLDYKELAELEAEVGKPVVLTQTVCLAIITIINDSNCC